MIKIRYFNAIYYLHFLNIVCSLNYVSDRCTNNHHKNLFYNTAFIYPYIDSASLLPPLSFPLQHP